MIIRKYGVTLRRLTEEDIELVRVHRNSVEIQQQMFYSETISPEMQKKWFVTINNIYNHYFIIEYEGKKIGLIFGKNDDYNERTTEGGIFIWDKQQLNSLAPVIASIIFTELTFTFREMKRIYATVKKQNQQVINYISQLGYKLAEEFPAEEKLIYVLTKEDYFSKATKIKKAVALLSKDLSDISEKDIDVSGIDQDKKGKLYSTYPDYLQQKFERLF
jgi:RimJ/RimL family protein N-acetyltransferase